MTYDSRDFVERNRDALDRELSQAMYECDHPILKVLFPEGKIFYRNLVFLLFFAILVTLGLFWLLLGSRKLIPELLQPIYKDHALLNVLFT